jgi:LDH2 family malate/lactate/ureidoglycolate dehydrogenase
MVAPHGSYEPIFGTNPLAIGIPTVPRPQVDIRSRTIHLHLLQILDMATSAEAWFGLVTAESEGKSIRPDIAYDAQGNETTSPTAALSGALRVFDRSYKGSHLALMIELLAGAMTGASMNDKKESKNWGSLVIAIDPAEFSGSLEEFQTNAMVMCDRVKNAKRLEGVSEIMLPGERGDIVEARNTERGAIEISENVYNKLRSFLEVGEEAK